MAIFPGDKLGPYEILAQIGAGGMGEVFKARDTRLERLVALKRLNDQHSGRFRQEARAIAALNHPNICQIYDIGPDYLIMEYIEGRPLAGPLPIDEALRIGIQMADALVAAHARGILHRDLKPGNILVTGTGTIKLIDFGLAKQISNSDADVTQSVEGAIVGTIAYMAPEQAQGQPMDERSDVFSFGAVFYEALSGQRPFRGASTAGVLSSLLRDQPQPLAVPPALQNLVAKCLAKAPQHRFATVIELKAALEELANQSIERNPSNSFVSFQPMARTNVGRDTQLAQMTRAYARVKDGRGVMVAVTGEAGIGKTSVLEHFLTELASRGERATIGRGRCSQRLAGDEPYLPILELLESLLRPHTGPSVSALMKAVAPTWYTLVSLESSSASLERESLPAASQERMKREFGALAKEISRTQPLVLFIDDLHWADVSTVDILNYLAGRFEQTRVMVLGSYRPSDMALSHHPFLAIRNDLQARGLLEEIGLTFLSEKDVEHYLSLEYPGNRFPANFPSVIQSKTEGNPLFMADLVRYLRDTGGIVQEQGQWALGRSLPESPRDLPASVRGMIERKIGQVDERDHALLAAASIQGTEFDSAILAEVLELDPSDIEERLDKLERVHVFVKKSEESEFPDRTLTVNYRFVHVLYQNALYDSIQPTRRTDLSGRIARALVKHYGDEVETVAARIAVLFEAARDFSGASQYYYAAARRSIELFAFREALSLSERGLKALKGLPDGPARKQQELVLQMSKGIALRSTSGWATPQIETVFTKARQLCQDLQDPPELIPVLWATTLFSLIRGNLIECRDRAAELMSQAERSANPAYVMCAHHLSGVVREFLGDMVGASRHLECCRELHVPSKHVEYVAMFGQDPGTIGRAMSARPLLALGYVDSALTRAQETVSIARSQQLPTMVAFALLVLQGIHVYRGEAEPAILVGDEIAGLCRDYELPQEALWSLAFRGYALHLLGRTDEGIDALQRSLDAQKAISARLVRSAFLAFLADALRSAGRVDECFEALEEGYAHVRETAEGGYTAGLHRVRGELLLTLGKQEEGEASLREALAYGASQQGKFMELRAATSLARLLNSTGRKHEARTVLTPLCEWFTEGHNTPDLVSARTLLSEIG